MKLAIKDGVWGKEEPKDWTKRLLFLISNVQRMLFFSFLLTFIRRIKGSLKKDRRAERAAVSVCTDLNQNPDVVEPIGRTTGNQPLM